MTTFTQQEGTGMQAGAERAMLTVHDVAQMLNCSARTIYRLADAGKLPRPVKLNALVRWPRETIERWIAEGCPSIRTGGHR